MAHFGAVKLTAGTGLWVDLSPVLWLILFVAGKSGGHQDPTLISRSVMVQAVVLADGTVGEMSLIKSLDAKLGLDQQALAAAKQWLFKPATKDGKPVAVRIRIELTFTLK